MSAPKGNRFASKPPAARMTERRAINLPPSLAIPLDDYLRRNGMKWNPFIRGLLEKIVEDSKNPLANDEQICMLRAAMEAAQHRTK